MTGPEKEAFAVLEQFLGDDLAKDIIAHRRGMKAPLTGRGAKSLIKEYQKTGDAVSAAEHHLNMGWRGFSAEWMKPKGRYFNDTANPAPRETMADYATRLLNEHDRRALGEGSDTSAYIALEYTQATRSH
jgi:hypothetical protein